MARASRLAGAILASSDDGWFLIGNTKVPCDWEAAGFDPPGAVDARAQPYLRLSPRRAIAHAPPVLTLSLEGEALAACLAARFLIERNGSVSDRLWRLVVSPSGAIDDDGEPPDEVDARWLTDMPTSIWDIVKGTVLRCL